MHSQNAESMFGFIPFKSLHLHETKGFKEIVQKSSLPKRQNERIFLETYISNFTLYTRKPQR